MHLQFYVQGRPPGSSPDPSTLDSLVEWSRTKAATLSELTLEESVAWIKEYAAHVRDKSKRLFRYLSGKPLPPPSLPALPPLEENARSENPGTSVWSLAGLFSSLRGPSSRSSVPMIVENDQVWTEGEVHVELIMVSVYYIVCRF
jgi:import inner membrane translocase subunit TIM21